MDRTPRTFEEEVRETVVKSSLTGVAATVLAVTVFSPAGLGGMIGTSLASGFALDPNMSNADANVFARLPAYPTPLTAEELSDIHARLARTSASLEITRAATDAKIERMRSLALADGVSLFAIAPPAVAASDAGLRLTMSEPEQTAAPSAPAAPVATRDEYLELAELMLAHENL